MSSIAGKIIRGKATADGKPTAKAGASQTAKIVKAKPGVLGKSGG